MNRKVMVLFLSLLLLLSSVPLAASAKQVDSATVAQNEVIKATLYQIVLDQKTNPSSKWKGKNISISSITPVYDATGDITAYVATLQTSGVNAGFVEISASKDEYPILSFSYDAPIDNQALQALENKREDKNKMTQYRLSARVESRPSVSSISNTRIIEVCINRRKIVKYPQWGGNTSVNDTRKCMD